MPDNCSFETVRTENLGFCPNEEVVGGVKAEVAHIPMAQLQTITKPTITEDTTYEDSIKIPNTGLVPVTGKGFKKMTLTIDENELKSNLVGNKGNLKDQAQFDGMLPNFIAKTQGFIKRHKNTPMCYVITDSTGKKWVLLDAYMTKADSTTAKKYEESAGTAFNVISNGPLYSYEGTLTILADEPATP
ncbi:hypothetical protein [Chryseobacterium sp. ZHDP1]|uniref:hypothetical protein n=1 Tax=Chryseobacterium sp. ZHDP1 TaxID=2838877 RepID=UPI001BDFF909|nr:hypothetical protein [Chryseobacterium sp. ZHDP1]QWA38865.1 hypothetical protein KKI44_01235 [Chryseobacterium sp. ZHDP1]